MAASTHISAPRGAWLSHLTGSFHVLRDSIVQRRRLRRTVRELEKLNSRQLDDLGLSRSNLHRAAFNAVYTGQR